MIEGERYSDNFKKFARFSLRLCNLSHEVGVSITGDCGNMFCNSFFATVGTSALWQGKALIHLKYIPIITSAY